MKRTKKAAKKATRKKKRRQAGKPPKTYSFTLPKRKAGRPPTLKGRLARLEANALRTLAEIAEMRGLICK